MKTPIGLHESEIKQVLKKKYGIDTLALGSVPEGNAGYSYVVKEKSGARYFLKIQKVSGSGHNSLKRIRFSSSALSKVFRSKRVSGVPEIILIGRGNRTVPFGQDYLGKLLEYIPGENFSGKKVPKRVCAVVADILAELHALKLRFPAKDKIIEKFDPAPAHELDSVLRLLGTQKESDPLRREARSLILEQEGRLKEVLKQFDAVAHLLSKASLPYVLCHGDAIPANILETPAKKVFLVDWDGSKFAPREMDLCYISLQDPVFLQRYLDRCPGFQPNLDVIRYYTYARFLKGGVNLWSGNIFLRGSKGKELISDLARLRRVLAAVDERLEGRVEKIKMLCR